MKAFLWVLLAVLTLGYLLPASVAGIRDHRNAAGIFLLNFFLGWTILGWIGALIWAVSAQDPQPQPVVVNVQTGPGGQVVASAVPAPPQPTAEYCPQCGKRREGTLSFCSNCGAKLA